MVSLLLDAGADTKMQDNQGRDWAQVSGIRLYWDDIGMMENRMETIIVIAVM